MTAIIVNTYEAKTRLSQLIAQARQGADVRIAHRGKPLVRLVPTEEPPRRQLGTMPLDQDIPLADFGPMTEEELALWEGGGQL